MYMKEFLCMPHNLAFTTEQLYKEHKATHTLPLPEGITPEMLPDEEFIKKVKEIESPKPIINNPVLSNPPPLNIDPKSSTTNVLPKVDQLPLPEKKPLELTYKWSGQCPTHGYDVQTLTVNIGRSFVVIAYCPQGHQVNSRAVTPLDRKVTQGLEPVMEKSIAKKKKV